jgi:hypothetical protein
MPQALHQRSVRHGREMVFQLRQTHSSTYPLISDLYELAPLPIRDCHGRDY